MPLSAAEHAAILEAAMPLPPSLRDAFKDMVIAELACVPDGNRGPGLTYRVIAAAQRECLRGGLIAVGGAKFGRPYVFRDGK